MKKQAIITAAIAAALYFGATANAQENVKGLGAMTCIAFFQAVNEAPKEEIDAFSVGLFSWFQGYATGKNLQLAEFDQKDVSGLLPMPILNEVEDICKSYPSVHLYEVAEKMFESLPPYIRASNEV